jgi:LPXTG-motif cell wall-anchored protein
VGGYELESVENNSGINYGTIKLVNKEVIGYVLPETGGAGTQMYTMAGLLLMLTSAAYLMYIHTKRRKEVN